MGEREEVVQSMRATSHMQTINSSRLPSCSTTGTNVRAHGSHLAISHQKGFGEFVGPVGGNFCGKKDNRALLSSTR